MNKPKMGDHARGGALPEIQRIPPKNADQGVFKVQGKIELVDRSMDGLTFRQYLNAARFTHYQHKAAVWIPKLREQLRAYGVGAEPWVVY